MKATTKFKWETHVRGRVVRRLGRYVAHLAIAAAALLFSSQTPEQSILFRSSGSWSGEWDTMDPSMMSDVLQVTLLLTNTYMLWNEVTEVRVTLVEQTRLGTNEQKRKLDTKDATCWTALTEHLSSGWNLCDLAGIVALYVASAGHFTGNEVLLQQVGAIGVLLNAFSFLKLAQPLDVSMGTLIEVLTRTGSSSEVLGFGGVLLVLIWGFGAAFSVSMPSNAAFYTTNRTVLPGLLTTTMAMVGDFDVDQYEFGAPFLMFILFLYIVIIVMFNVLIAIVSDLYADVKMTEDVEVDMRRAEAIINAEARMSMAGSTELRNPAYFPEFLEVLRVEIGSEKVEQVKVRQVQEDVAKLSAKVDENMAKLSAKVDENMAEQAEHNGKMAQMADDVAELKALMVQLLGQGTAPAAKSASSSFQSSVAQVMTQNRRAKQLSMVQ
jgi:hypothetical protein